MRFYIDFEATQFSNRIISVGCVCENGNTFKSLVKPVNKGKITPLLTGLTKDLKVLPFSQTQPTLMILLENCVASKSI